MNIPKQDKQGVRTASDIERKYNFGQSFAEAFDLAEQAKREAERAGEKAENAGEAAANANEAAENANQAAANAGQAAENANQAANNAGQLAENANNTANNANNTANNALQEAANATNTANGAVQDAANANNTANSALAEAAAAMTKANQAVDTAELVDQKMNAEDIFNILTNNGAEQGVYRGQDGKIYINVTYAQAGVLSADLVDATALFAKDVHVTDRINTEELFAKDVNVTERINTEELFANDITMNGKFTHTAQAYISPGYPEIETMQKHILSIEKIPTNKIPLYDFSGDGEVTVTDVVQCNQMMIGTRSFKDWSGAQQSTVTVTIDLSVPEKAIRISGTNMWGRVVDYYLGVQGLNAGRVTCDAVAAGSGSFNGDVSVSGDQSVGGKLYVTGAISLPGGVGSNRQVLCSSGGGANVWRNMPSVSYDLLASGVFDDYVTVSDGYEAYLVVARPSSSGAHITVTIPRSALNSGLNWQVADESAYLRFQASWGGGDPNFSINGGHSSGGYIAEVYGIG